MPPAGLATLGINYYDLGYQTGLMALKVLADGADISTMPVEFATGFDAAFNAETAEAIGVNDSGRIPVRNHFHGSGRLIKQKSNLMNKA